MARYNQIYKYGGLDPSGMQACSDTKVLKLGEFQIFREISGHLAFLGKKVGDGWLRHFRLLQLTLFHIFCGIGQDYIYFIFSPVNLCISLQIAVSKPQIHELLHLHHCIFVLFYGVSYFLVNTCIFITLVSFCFQ